MFIFETLCYLLTLLSNINLCKGLWALRLKRFKVDIKSVDKTTGVSEDILNWLSHSLSLRAEL